jgi:hypothetical protein
MTGFIEHFFTIPVDYNSSHIELLNSLKTGFLLNNIVTCTPLMRRVLVRMIGFILRWLHTHS